MSSIGNLRANSIGPIKEDDNSFFDNLEFIYRSYSAPLRAEKSSFLKDHEEDFESEQQRLDRYNLYKHLLQLNGHKPDFDIEAERFSKKFPVKFAVPKLPPPFSYEPKDLTSNLSKFSPNIDSLRSRLNLGYTIQPINRGWILDSYKFTDFSRLHVAVFNNDIKTIKQRLFDKSKAVINSLIQKKDVNDLTALHWAVILGNKETLKVILSQIKSEDRLAAINMQDLRGWSVFRWALEIQDEEMIKIFISSLQDEDKSFLVSSIDQFKKSHLHHAVETGNNKIVSLLLDLILFEREINTVANIENYLKQTIVDLAFDVLDSKTFEKLIVKLYPNRLMRSKALQRLDYQNQTLLYKAILRSDHKMLNVLMRNILPEDLQKYLSQKDKLGRTAFHLSIDTGSSKQCISLLLNKVDRKYFMSYIMQKDKRGMAAIHSLFSDIKVFDKLLTIFKKIKDNSKDESTYKENILDVVSQTDALNRSLLHYIVLNGDNMCFNLIFDQFNEKDLTKKLDLLSQKDRFNKTILHYLLDASFEIINNFGTNKFLEFIEKIFSIIPQKFLSYFLSLQDCEMKTPFYYATIVFEEEIKNILLLFCKIPINERRAFLETEIDCNGNTCLHFLAINNKERLLIELLKNINESDRKDLLIKENKSKKSVIQYIRQARIFEDNLSELLAIFSKDEDFQKKLNYELDSSTYLFDDYDDEYEFYS